MKVRTFLVFLLLVTLMNCVLNQSIHQPPLALENPVVDEYFGLKISDPYRYMENLQDYTVQRWFKTQANYSRWVLNRIPGRQKLIDKMIEFDSRKTAEVYGLKITENDRYFYSKQTPADQAGKLYYRDGYNGDEILLFDPEKYSDEKTKEIGISSVPIPSADGSKIVFTIASNSTEVGEVLIMDVNSAKIYPERIHRCWLVSPAWLPDGKGFLYNRRPSGGGQRKDQGLDNRIYLHKIGTDPSADVEIFSRQRYPGFEINLEDDLRVSFDNNCNYIFVYLASADRRLNVFYAPYSEIAKEKIGWKHLFKPEDDVYSFITTDKEIYILTPKNAPNFKVLKTSLTYPNLAAAKIVIPEDPFKKLKTFNLTNDGLYYVLSENSITSRLLFLPWKEGTIKEIDLPFAAGSVSLSTKGYKHGDIWVSLMGWTSYNQRYRYSLQKNEFTPENLSSQVKYPEYADLTVEELMVPSHDSVMVPLSLVYKSGMKKNGKNPVFLWGYGAYGSNINSPFFNPNFFLWTLEGGILAFPHVRGGGELGTQWYKDGFKTTKPNTWKDLIACTEYLIKENYTSPKKIAINSISAGGILIGRAMTERPDLFAVAIPETGWLNTLRGEETPNGPINVSEFGTVKDSVECMALIEMDAYLHIKDGVRYPATLVTAGMNDTRVMAWLPAKFAARLQAANASDKPILFRLDYEAGNGIGETKTKQFEKQADVFSFALWQTGHPDFKLKGR